MEKRRRRWWRTKEDEEVDDRGETPVRREGRGKKEDSGGEKSVLSPSCSLLRAKTIIKDLLFLPAWRLPPRRCSLVRCSLSSHPQPLLLP